MVGIGASAGGLDAFTRLLRALPVDTGMAFVLVQHLAPARESALAGILSRATRMPVAEVTDEPLVKPNRVYVIPPARNMIMVRGHLKLLRRSTHGVHHPIDLFFRSLAQNQRERAIGVVLSGTATDGTLGLEEIKAEGGITFAQDDTAQYNGMPRSAVASGCVDFTLPPDAIAREVARIAAHPYVARAKGRRAATAESAATRDKSVLAPILDVLRTVTGVDFESYKANTLGRRITRRMVLLKLDDLNAYARQLRKDPAEVEALYQDILIGVTSFFRDRDMFEDLKKKVLPAMMKGRPRNDPLRVWVMGCSTGEEAYSLAMLCTEVAVSSNGRASAQIFATDLNASGIDHARAGVYSRHRVQDVSRERLRTFFTESGGSYRVVKSIRDMCVFARHNAMADAPFSRIDLISCRNLLIYLEPTLQQRAIRLFHYALKPSGRLVLGASETVGPFRDLFQVESAKHKIFSRKPGPSRQSVGSPALLPRSSRAAESAKGPVRPGETLPVPRAPGAGDVHREADRLLLSRFAPPGVLVNSDLEILQFRGNTEPYLTPAQGKATLSLLKMVRAGLLVPLKAMFQRAKKEMAPVREAGLRLETRGRGPELAIEIVPVIGDSGSDAAFMVLFEETIGKDGPPLPAAGAKGKAAARGSIRHQAKAATVARLEQELATTREYLQSLSEQQDAANEELQSANEEAQSANEELQSINEELETSKEEIESSNEELSTVNDELSNRIAELGQLNGDLTNLIGSVHVAIVIVGRDLRIRRHSAIAEKLLGVNPTDIGRPITDLRLALEIDDLDSMLAETIDTVSAREREIQDRRGCWYSLRIRPYMTLDNKIDGAVLMLVDIDPLKRSELALAAARDHAQGTLEAVREPLLVLDAAFRVESANHAYYQSFGTAPASTVGKSFFGVDDSRWDIPELRALLEDPRNRALDNFSVEFETGDAGPRSMLLNARPIEDPAGGSKRILLAIEDVTPIQRARDYAEAIIRTTRDPLLILDDALQVRTASETYYSTFGVSREQTLGHSMFELGNGQWKNPALRKLLEDILPRHSHFDGFEVAHDFEGIGRRTMLLNARALSATRDEPASILLGIQDVTELLHFQAALRRSEVRYRRLFEAARDGVLILDPDSRKIVDSNPFMTDLLGYPREELLGKELFEIGLVKDEAASRAAFRELKAKGFIRFEDLPLETRSGERREVEMVSNLYQVAGEDVIQCNIREITARKRTEEALRLSEAKFRQLADSLPQIVWTARPDGFIDYYNERWYQFTGFGRDQYGERSWEPILHPDDVERWKATHYGCIQSGANYQIEYRFKDRRDSGYRWFMGRALPIRNDSGEVVRWFGTCTDIDDVKRAEEEHRSLQETLASRIEELAAIDISKGRFLAVLSHELRSPLNAIQSWVHILKNPGTSEEDVRRGVDVIDRNSRLQGQLIGELLDAHRIGAGKASMQLEHVDLVELVDSALAAVEPVAAQRRIRVEREIGPGPVPVFADPARLQQVLGNLLSNALKFTPEGGLIRIELSRSGSGARVSVTDSGEGILAESLAHIFEPFRQGDSTASRGHGGLGLGLSIARQLVQLHGGSIEATSVGKGAGSTFTMTIPLRDPEGPPRPGIAPGTKSSEPSSLSGVKVLVVDDEPDVREPVRRALEEAGAEVVAVASADEALLAVRQQRPDVLVSDIAMPGRDGYELMRSIRALPPGRGGRLPAIALTAYAAAEDREMAFRVGYKLHLVKPVEPGTLIAAVAELAAPPRIPANLGPADPRETS